MTRTPRNTAHFGRILTAALLLCVTMFCSFAHATVLTPGNSAVPNAQGDPFAGSAILGDTGSENYSASLNGESISGTAREWVLQGYSGNPFGSAKLTFVLQVSLTGGSSSSGGSPVVERVNNSGYAASVQTDVGYSTVSGQVSPSTANRPLNGNLVAFNFLPPGASVQVGQSTNYLIINTDATSFTTSTITIQNSVAANVSGFGPVAVPEPGMLGLLGVGALILGAKVRRGRR